MALGRIGVNPDLANVAVDHGIGAGFGVVQNLAWARGNWWGTIISAAPIVAKVMTTGNTGLTARLIDSTSMSSAGVLGYVASDKANLNSRLPFSKRRRTPSARELANAGGGPANRVITAPQGSHAPNASVEYYNGRETRKLSYS